MKKLRELIDASEIVAVKGDLDILVSGLHYDSRKLSPQNCFVAIQGLVQDGKKYVAEALAKGANSIVSSTPVNQDNVTWIQVKNERSMLAKMAASFYDYPAKDMYVVGVTGTNGKTTVVSLLNDIFDQHGLTARIGTLGMRCGELVQKTALTTPEALEIYEFLHQCQQHGCLNLVMEVSSAGLKLGRVNGIKFSQAIFTSFSGDHLDFHGNMDDYFDSKMILFSRLSADDWAIINIDDPYAMKVIDHLNSHYVTFGFSENADILPLKYRFSVKGIEADIRTPRGRLELKSPLVGRVNLLNIMAAMASAIIKGIPSEKILSAISQFPPVRGRLDFAYKGDFSVLIDYAHTDKALEAMLKSVREITKNRIVLVFGAGGSRDKTKRPRMGAVASALSDQVIITSDNPRQEDPMDIIKDILTGFPEQFKNFIVEPDRKRAIKIALESVEKGDVVVIAGKGHEDYQIFKDRVITFDDYGVVTELIGGNNA